MESCGKINSIDVKYLRYIVAVFMIGQLGLLHTLLIMVMHLKQLATAGHSSGLKTSNLKLIKACNYPTLLATIEILQLDAVQT